MGRVAAAALLLWVQVFGLTPPRGQSPELSFETLPDALQLERLAGVWLGLADLNRDGLQDVLVGGTNHYSLNKEQLYVLLSNGDGSLTDATRKYLPRKARAATPLAVVADLNGDGAFDVALFDAGNQELGQHPDGGFFGEKPHLLLSRPGKQRLKYSKQLASAVLDAKRRDPNLDQFEKELGPELHLKAITAADIDGDGDVDMFGVAEGGYQNPPTHFYVNRGGGRFDVDFSRARFDRGSVFPFEDDWRNSTSLLADLDGDDRPDLIEGQQRKATAGRERQTSRIIFNDGSGGFPGPGASPESASEVLLPQVPMAGGFTAISDIAVGDIDGDGDPDLVLGHSRQGRPAGVFDVSRYIQVLVNLGGRRFRDDTNKRMGSQALQTKVEHPEQGENRNLVGRLELVDLDADGDLDLFMGGSASVDRYAPLIYQNDGRGRFEAIAPEAITEGRTSFAENAFPIDLDGDGVLDFIHADTLPGPDGDFGTADDRHQIISTMVTIR